MSRLDRYRDLLLHAAARVLPAHYTSPTPHYLREKALKDLSSAFFKAGDRLGVHVLPKHFYTPVADYAWLRRNRAVWDRPAEMVGVDWDLDRQIAWLEERVRPFLPEAPSLDAMLALERSHVGPGFEPIDGLVLHGVIRSLRPRRVIEIGSGVSTAVMSDALARNERESGSPAMITAIDPYPLSAVQAMERVEVVKNAVQHEPLSRFDDLQRDDLLFIDSSHAVKVGSDVVRLLLEIIPRLRAGVVIHVHDINLPYLYPRTALADYFGWQETALIYGLLVGNRQLEVLACLSALHYDRQGELRRLLPDYRPQANDAGMRAGDWHLGHFPSSLYLRASGA